MKELITIKNENGKQLVSARELHEGLKVKSNFTTWIKRMLEYGFVEGTDYLISKIGNLENTGFGGLGTPKTDFIITLDMGKQIAMIQKTPEGHRYRQYFIECEKKLQQIQQPKLPTTYKEALLELVATIEEKERIEEEKNRLIHVGKNYTTTEMAKELGFRSAVAFNNDLKEKKIQYKVNGTWVLAARYAELGYQSIKQTELENGKIVYSKYWTGLGRDWLLNKIYK